MSKVELETYISLIRFDDPTASNPIYEFVTALRCCLVKRASPQNWSVLTAMERHQKEREGDEYYKVNQVSIIEL